MSDIIKDSKKFYNQQKKDLFLRLSDKFENVKYYTSSIESFKYHEGIIKSSIAKSCVDALPDISNEDIKKYWKGVKIKHSKTKPSKIISNDLQEFNYFFTIIKGKKAVCNIDLSFYPFTKEFYLRGIMVNPKDRNKGIATKVINTLKDYCLDNLFIISLESNEDDTNEFWLNRGFVKLSTISGVVNENNKMVFLDPRPPKKV